MINIILLKKWFYRWKGGVNLVAKRSVNDSDSNPSDSTSEDSSRTDNTISTPELIEMEYEGAVKYKKLSYHSVEKLINKYYLVMIILLIKLTKLYKHSQKNIIFRL